MTGALQQKVVFISARVPFSRQLFLGYSRTGSLSSRWPRATVETPSAPQVECSAPCGHRKERGATVATGCADVPIYYASSFFFVYSPLDNFVLIHYQRCIYGGVPFTTTRIHNLRRYSVCDDPHLLQPKTVFCLPRQVLTMYGVRFPTPPATSFYNIYFHQWADLRHTCCLWSRPKTSAFICNV